MKKAIFGGGCFWCMEPVFRGLKGIASVKPGYSGGDKENPTYEEVSIGETGHAEVVEVAYDESLIEYEELVNLFFSAHNPTTLNKQDGDVGSQYRSIIFYQDEEQKRVAESVVARLEEEKKFDNKIVTEIVPFEKFYVAEEEHYNYYEKNPNKVYCRLVISPKLRKLRTRRSELVTK